MSMWDTFQRNTTTIRAILTEIENMENDVASMYRSAESLHRAGGLTEKMRTDIHAQREYLFLLQHNMYAAILSAISQLPLGSDLIASQIPEPQKRPDLPAANVRAA